MSAETYLIECVSAEGDVACFKLHSEEGEAPLKKSFYLEVLVECYRKALKGQLNDDDIGAVAVASREDYLQKATSSPMAGYFDRLYPLLLDQRVPISADQYAAYQADPASFEAQYGVKTSGAGMQGDGGYYYKVPADIVAFEAAAEADIVRITPLQVAQGERDEDNPYLWAEVEFQVANPQLLHHCMAGTVWSSCIYELY
jgi:hypothetical protein